MDAAHEPTLYLLCGKIAAGKSTLARRLAARPATLLISEDHWTSNLFYDDLKTIEDYGRCSARLRAAMGPHVVDILRQGLSIVLDFPANTVSSRDWIRSLITQSGAAHELHLLDIPDAICRQRLRERNAGGEHPFQVSEVSTTCSRAISLLRGLARASTSSFTAPDPAVAATPDAVSGLLINISFPACLWRLFVILPNSHGILDRVRSCTPVVVTACRRWAWLQLEGEFCC